MLPPAGAEESLRRCREEMGLLVWVWVYGFRLGLGLGCGQLWEVLVKSLGFQDGEGRFQFMTDPETWSKSSCEGVGG